MEYSYYDLLKVPFLNRDCFRESFLQTAVQPPLERKWAGSVSLKGLLVKAALYQINFNFYCCWYKLADTVES